MQDIIFSSTPSRRIRNKIVRFHKRQISPVSVSAPRQTDSLTAAKSPVKKNHEPFDLSAGFRDIPYEFSRQNNEKYPTPTARKDILAFGTLTKPQRLFALPEITTKQTVHRLLAISPKKLAANLAILSVLFCLLLGLFSQLRGLGRGLQVIKSLQQPIITAYHQMLNGSAALAKTDFAASERDFGQAAILLNQSRSKLNDALAISAVLLRYADVTGTVRSGEELLTAAEHLSLAGQSISRGANLILSRLGEKSFVAAVTQATNEIDSGLNELKQAEQSLNNVDSPMLPPEIQSQIVKLKESIPPITQTLNSLMDQSSTVLSILGDKHDRQYLLIFQNNHEIRPTGGFIGSLGVVDIDRGVIEKVDINSVYDPDGQLEQAIAPPEPLRHIVNQWYLRDANWFVDFPVSARKIMEFFEKEKGPTVDGVIALTPEVIRELLSVTGPIDLPSYQVTVSYDNFWAITQDQVSYSYDQKLNKPKQFLADLAPVLLNKLFATPPSSSLQVLDVLTKMIRQKHLLVYFNDQDLQRRLSQLGWSGELPADEPNFLAVNNTNIAGHKSDQFIEQEIDYRLELDESGATDAVVTIRRTHRGPQESSGLDYPAGENPAFKDNIIFQRVLVPLGATLEEARGFTSPADIPQTVVPENNPYLEPDPDLAQWQTGQVTDRNGTIIGREAGYTFFANWLVTRPGETSVALYRYRLPGRFKLPTILDPAVRFQAYVYKQPGDTRTILRTEFKLPSSLMVVHAVPDSGVTQPDDRSLIYRTSLAEDVLTGVVIVKRDD